MSMWNVIDAEMSDPPCSVKSEARCSLLTPSHIPEPHILCIRALDSVAPSKDIYGQVTKVVT